MLASYTFPPPVHTEWDTLYSQFIKKCFAERYEERQKNRETKRNTEFDDHYDHEDSDDLEDHYLLRIYSGSVLRQYSPQFHGMDRKEIFQNVKIDLEKGTSLEWIQNPNLLPSRLQQFLNQVQSNIKSRTFGEFTQMYTFPMHVGTSHLFPQDWELIFNFFDLALAKNLTSTTYDEEMAVNNRIRHRMRNIQSGNRENETEVPPVVLPRRDVFESLWQDLVYNERVKDSQNFWKLERILNLLAVNPVSSHPLTTKSFYPEENAPGTKNPLIVMNILKSQRRKRIQALALDRKECDDADSRELVNDSDDANEDDDQQRKTVTCTKVLAVLLYFMNDVSRDRLARAYLRSIKEKFGVKFVELMIFALYIAHVRVGLFGGIALDIIQSELAKGISMSLTRRY